MQQWDNTLNEIAKRNADKHKIPTDLAKELVDCYNSCNLKEMRNKKAVVWINIGKFFINPRAAADRILMWFKRFRSGECTREKLLNRLEVYLPLHKIAKEHHPLTGKLYRFRLAAEQLAKEGKKPKRNY